MCLINTSNRDGFDYFVAHVQNMYVDLVIHPRNFYGNKIEIIILSLLSWKEKPW